MSDWPEHSEELARKSLETLERAIYERTEGQISDEELLIVAQTLTATVQGLVPQNVFDTIYAFEKDLGHE
jgi:hypothetical protein